MAWAKQPFKVMVWAGIPKKGATDICLVNGSLNSAACQEVLHMHLLPFLRNHLVGDKFQQDNAPCHTFKSTMKFLKDNDASLLPTPPESPDLNQIEKMWHDLKHFIWTTVKTHYKENCFKG